MKQSKKRYLTSSVEIMISEKRRVLLLGDAVWLDQFSALRNVKLLAFVSTINSQKITILLIVIIQKVQVNRRKASKT